MTRLPKVIVRRGLASIHLNPSPCGPILELLSLPFFGSSRDFPDESVSRKRRLNRVLPHFRYCWRIPVGRQSLGVWEGQGLWGSEFPDLRRPGRIRQQYHFPALSKNRHLSQTAFGG